MNILKTRMMQAANPALVEGLSRFFKTGKRDEARLVSYLRQRWNGIPATMRRYACEKLPNLFSNAKDNSRLFK